MKGAIEDKVDADATCASNGDDSSYTLTLLDEYFSKVLITAMKRAEWVTF